jgi:hypothetical protein
LALTACGSACRRSTSSAASGSTSLAAAETSAAETPSTGAQFPGEPPKDKDEDRDNLTRSYYDKDDSEILAYGRPAASSEAKAIAEVVLRYFAAAARDDGTTACASLYSLFAESIPETYGQGPASTPALRGKTCPIVLTKMFVHNRGEFAPALGRTKVIASRIEGLRGLAVLGARAVPERYILVHREFGAWKVLNLSSRELP